ncbi:MAG TPA: aspartate kinase, partial [Flavisolibacter sp.]|nr:aspartate kinase [Flavisolibacter sp.]
MQVLKFGGTSVAHSKNIKKVRSIVTSKQKARPMVVVVSAFSGVTDKLLLCGLAAIEGNDTY